MIIGRFKKLNKFIYLILHHVCYHNNVFVVVMPAFIWVLPSNQFNDDIIPMRDPQCTGIQGVLTCLEVLLYYLMELLGWGTIIWWRFTAILHMATRIHTPALCCNVLWSTTGGNSQHNLVLLTCRRADSSNHLYQHLFFKITRL